jgi:hypothetical protein
MGTRVPDRSSTPATLRGAVVADPRSLLDGP